MPGELAAAAAGITTPSQGSVFGDVADVAGGFLSGIQEEKERKEKQALEEARVALLERSQTEVERAAGVAEIDADLNRAVQQDLADAQLLSGQAQADAQERLQDIEDERRRNEIRTAQGRRDILANLYGVDPAITEGMDFVSLGEMIEQKNNEADRAAGIEEQRLFSAGNIVSAQTALLNEARIREADVRGELSDLAGIQQQELANFIERGLVPGVEGEGVGLEFERALEIASFMDPEDLQRSLDIQNEIAGMPTIAERQGELEAALIEAVEAREEAASNLQAISEGSRPAGEDTGGGTGAPGPGIGAGAPDEGAPDAQEPVANPNSSAAQGFMSLLDSSPVVAIRNYDQMQAVGSSALPDVEARLTNIGISPEDIRAEADQITLEAQEAAAAEAPNPAEVTRAARAERQANLGGPEEDFMQAIGGADADPDVKAIATSIKDAAGEQSVLDNVKEIAIARVQSELGQLEGSDSLQAARAGIQELIKLGVSRLIGLDSIKDKDLRQAVADRTQNRIGPT